MGYGSTANRTWLSTTRLVSTGSATRGQYRTCPSTIRPARTASGGTYALLVLHTPSAQYVLSVLLQLHASTPPCGSTGQQPEHISFLVADMA
eukprot:393100-Rhodomonas_salina.3